MYSIFGFGYGQAKGVCSVSVVLCLRSEHELLKWWIWRLQSYICTWKQLNVNCGGYICTKSYTEELYWRATYMYLEPYLEAAECELWWLDTLMEIMKVVVNIPV